VTATPAHSPETSLTNALPPGPRSEALFQQAKAVFPDGTTRATIERDPVPLYAIRGEGAYLVDADGQRFLDLNGNFTTLIHGHAFEPVIAAVKQQLDRGSCFANPTEAEIRLAALLCERVPQLEHIRFVNTGTEAVMFAVKAARALTGRPGIAKIEGAYHGAYDWVEVGQSSVPANWGDADAPSPVPQYAGMPGSVPDDVIMLRFNDAEGARRQLAMHADRLAAVLIDPMPSRAGLVAPEPEFIASLHDTARQHGILIISDEVLNFRQGYHGASALYGLVPDLFALGKIIGGGFPIGAIGGRRETMRVFDAGAGRPLLPQGGTFSANPISMVAGYETMTVLDRPAFDRLKTLGDALRAKLQHAAERAGAPFTTTGASSLLRIHPKRRAPRDFREAFMSAAEAGVMKELSRYFLRHGILLPAAAAASLSTPMGEADIHYIASIFEGFLIENAALVEEIA
jgi:glutamate-1-semialdehyde 2,1-aminomutase